MYIFTSYLAQVRNPLVSTNLGQGMDFFSNIFNSFISIAFSIAAVIFVFIFISGAFQWITSGADKGKLAEARAKITHAIVGLLVLLLIFLISRIVNYILGLNIGSLGNSSIPGVPNQVIISAYGTPSSGVYPNMELRIDGTLVSTFTVTGISADYQYTHPTNVTASQVSVVFTNDARTATDDRDLFVDYITVSGVRYDSSDPSTYSEGVWASGSCQPGYWGSDQLSCNGYFLYGQPVPTLAGGAAICTDTDNGIDEWVQGTVTRGSEVQRDTCASPSSVVEYYCNGGTSGVIGSTVVDCGFTICQNGECIPAPVVVDPLPPPTNTPALIPTTLPTLIPTATPTLVPTLTPTRIPTATPTLIPTARPTNTPTATPTTVPTATVIPPTSTPAIISPISFCTDTDGGVNITARGTVSENTTVSGVTTNSTDNCRSSSTLTEYSCGSGMNLVTQSVSCTNSLSGSICQSGDCCLWAGATCSSDGDCCSSLACDVNRVCSPTSNIVPNVALNTSCQNLCNSVGYANVASFGTDTNASNGAVYTYYNGACALSYAYLTNSIVIDQGGVECGGQRANWTNCNCAR